MLELTPEPGDRRAQRLRRPLRGGHCRPRTVERPAAACPTEPQRLHAASAVAAR
ncbi:MAG: hypothetical protein R2736_06930 [Solirubrobacterales bacterium]